MKTSLVYLLNQFAKRNNIQIDSDETRIQLLSHPYYPSIISITDLFNHFGIDNLALKADNNLDTFSQIPNTFLAQIRDQGSDQLVIVSKNDNDIDLIYDENNSKNVSIEKFLELWTGVIVIIEKPKIKVRAQSGETNKLKRITSVLSLIMLVLVYLFVKPSVFQIVHFALSCIGVYISFLIIQHELGLHSKILDKFCSRQSNKTNCDAVLSSKGATIFGLFKLSDVGLVYFTSLAMTWLIFALNGMQSTSVIFMLSSLAVPFTFLSIYYQWRVVKSWCPLCLTVVSILWLQFGILFLNTDFLVKLSLVDSSYLIFITTILIFTSLWIFIQSLLKKEQQFEKLEIKHIKFKRNYTLFKAALNLNSKINTTLPNVNEIVFGNRKALLNLIVITNPMCGFCKESHHLIEKILKKEDKNIQIIVRFNVQPNEEDTGTKIAAKILELYHTSNEDKCLNALSDIYSEMNASTWLKKWGMVTEDNYFTILKRQKEWCSNNKINFTPELIINGKQFPKEYDRMDLLYFIDELIEEQEILENSQLHIVEP